MANLTLAFNKVMILEGGGKYHVVRGDPGGATKWGVSQRAYPHLDIKNLSKLDALRIFELDYWIPARCPEIDNNQMAFEIVEFRFNANIGASARVAQRAANEVWRVAAGGGYLLVDGLLGSKTLESLNELAAMSPLAVFAWVARFNLLQLRYYRNLRPDLVKRFLAGWTRRVIE